MDSLLSHLAAHGALILFVLVLVDQLGIPLPAMPALIAAGALAREGRLVLGPSFAVSIVACLAAHLFWYEAGRRRGARVLGMVCRISLEPDACIRRTEDFFGRWGESTLVFAFFVPAFDTLAQVLAGIGGMRRTRFLAWNLAGALVWTGTFTGLGFVFHEQLTQLVALIEAAGTRVGVVLAVAIGLWIVWKAFQRTTFFRSLRIDRVTAAALHAKLEAGEPVDVVDVRHAIELRSEPRMLPRARLAPMEEITTRLASTPKDREIVLYCA